jgi:ribosomal protein S18 acetylase RimI-like enzyme
MSIQYRDIKKFQPCELQELFLSVQWEAGKHPEKLVVAMENSQTVYSAWDNKKLIGLINALDDKIMTVYIHFLLVQPEYQGKGVGKELLRMINDKYKEYLRVVLVADRAETGFYQNSGFELASGTNAMFINRFREV